MNATDDVFSSIVSEGIKEIVADFSEEMEDAPSSFELFEILACGLRSCPDHTTSDIHPSLVTKIKLNKTTKKLSGKNRSRVSELNDAVFVTANSMFADISSAFTKHNGQAPKLKEISTILLDALKNIKEELLSDISFSNIKELNIEANKSSRKRSTVGDVIFIPARNGLYHVGVVLMKNHFGTAYGLFDGTHELKSITFFSHPNPKKYPVYSGDEYVANGKWIIGNNDKELVNLFPLDPEIYHTPRSESDDSGIGPYGSGETGIGKLRDLNKEEAEELGLLNGEYNQVYSSNYFATYLDELEKWCKI
jgi:hypothetical protein